LGWIALLGVIVLLLIATASAYSGYQSAIYQRTAAASTQVALTLKEQFDLGIQDMEAKRFDQARQRFEYIIQNDPSYPGVTEKLAESLMSRDTTATPTIVPTPTVTPTPDMRGVEELRMYLFENGYRVIDDVIIPDAGRLYQVFSVEHGQDKLPEGWPADCFALGHRSLCDTHFPALAHQMLAQHEKRLKTARGTAGQELLEQKASHMRTVLELYEKQQNRD
jgi:hypothetical protein